MSQRDNRGMSPFLVFAAFLVGAVAVATAAVVVILRAGYDWPQRAAIGEMLAGVGAVLSVLSFGALLFTVLIQHRQYELQQKELIAGREAQKQATNALAKQIAMLAQTAECQALNTLVIQAEQTIDRWNEAKHRGDAQLLSSMAADMQNVRERRSRYVERLQIIVGALSKDSEQE